jgi:hypothetical protein
LVPELDPVFQTDFGFGSGYQTQFSFDFSLIGTGIDDSNPPNWVTGQHSFKLVLQNCLKLVLQKKFIFK